MAQLAHLHLPDGRRLEYRIRSSARTRNLCLRITMEGLTVSAPAWLSIPRIKDVVAGKSEWIAARLARLEGARPLAAATPLPGTIALPALAENWQVAYRQTCSRTVAARPILPGMILLSGAVDDDARCKAALRRWLARRAKEALGPRLETLAAETGLRFSRLTVKNQRTRWGSCSTSGAISLNCKLLFLPADLVRYVLVHELCHLGEHNHTTRYWALLLQHEPEAAALHRRIREAWSLIPGWAHPRRNRVIPGGSTG
ncbi:MAG: M48 family metallopeptidase [Desulfobulbaceae bacterium]